MTNNIYYQMQYYDIPASLYDSLVNQTKSKLIIHYCDENMKANSGMLWFEYVNELYDIYSTAEQETMSLDEFQERITKFVERQAREKVKTAIQQVEIEVQI